jgi:hypothetical protein
VTHDTAGPSPAQRDGTSQAARRLPALDPSYAPLDERSVADLLHFAQAFARELRFFDDQNRPDGDWSGFLAGEVAALARRLDGEEPAGQAPLQPHVALLLTFLDLLQHARRQLNELTGRHLEFYYREALGLRPRGPAPDSVHVLVELAPGQGEVSLPAGTLLSAGSDSQGAALFYATDAELVANRARVAALKSLFVHRRLIGLAEAARGPDRLARLFPESSKPWAGLPIGERAFMAMLAMALGEPGPGGALPAYPGAGEPPDTALLEDLDDLLRHVPAELAMPLPAFRTLMELRRRRAGADREWAQVNAALRLAGGRRDPDLRWDDANPHDFEANLLRALGIGDFASFFNTLPAVEDVYDLYRLRLRPDVRAFIDQGSLHLSFDEFSAMMGVVEGMYRDWRRIYDILRAAGRKKRPGMRLAPPMLRSYDPDKFGILVAATLGEIRALATRRLALEGLDGWYQALLDLEGYFHMPAEEFAAVRATASRGQAAQPWDWERVYVALGQAHAERNLARRLAALEQARLAGGVEGLLRQALGDPSPGDPLPDARRFRDLSLPGDEPYIRERLCLDPANFEALVRTAATFAAITDENRAQAVSAWAVAYRILEQAERMKRGVGEARLEVEQWDNIYAAADATRARARGQEAEVTPRWRTFGGAPGELEPGAVTSAARGLAVASPLLALAEGSRAITLRVALHPEQFDLGAVQAALVHAPFRLFLSAGGELLEAPPAPPEGAALAPLVLGPITARLDEGGAGELAFTLSLSPQAPPVAPLPGAAWPVLQLVLADRAEANDLIQRALLPLRLEQVTLTVEVSGITGLTLHNDDGPLNPQQPFEPFGFAPTAGAGLAIAHPELCAKRLDRLDLQIAWLGAPRSFAEHYRGYAGFDAPLPRPQQPASPVGGNESFKAQLRLFDNRAGFDVAQLQLFAAPDASAVRTLTVAGETIAGAAPGYRTLLRPNTAGEPFAWTRHWRLELLPPDFFHAVYPRAAAGYANRRDGDRPDPFVVNPPYTPKIKRLAVGYVASERIDPAAAAGSEGGALRHVEPFGAVAPAVGADGYVPLLPQHLDEGELYIGIAGLAPPQNLALLFQIAEGSADPNLAREAPRWSYLDGDRWKSLEHGRILGDTTDELRSSGVITFDLPPAASSARLPGGLYWLRAAVARNSRAVPDLVAIEAQAVRATFVDRGNAPEHLYQPLPPESITDLAEPQPEILALRQPFSSIGGKGEEDPARFTTRVSERLRHKGRALTSWDYERIVLETFPEIYKVKCLPVDGSADPRLAGSVRVIVVPDIRGKLPFDPFEPRVGGDTLWRIERHLAAHAPAAARFVVSNPAYVRLQVRLGVRLKPGHNPGFHLQRLGQELQRYLAPWAYDQSAEIVFGGRINANMIVNFVEERPYVDYVAGIKLFTRSGVEGDLPVQVDAQYSVPPDAILVSDRQHQIDLIGEERYQEQFFTGINYLQIELDFQIA